MTGSLSWLGKLKNSDPDFFTKVGNIKNSIGIQELCIGKAVRLKPFVQEIFDLEFLYTPPYFKLKHILVKELLIDGKIPDLIFDWSAFRIPRPKQKKQ